MFSVWHRLGKKKRNHLAYLMKLVQRFYKASFNKPSENNLVKKNLKGQKKSGELIMRVSLIKSPNV